MSGNIHYELFPQTVSPEQFMKWWRDNKTALLKIHTRKINRKFTIQDENGRQYQLIIRKGEAHLIPKLNKPPSNRELETELEALKKLDKQHDFLDNRVRAVESSFQRMLSSLNLPSTAEDEKLISESLYTPEQKEATKRLERRKAWKSEYQKQGVMAKVNAEMEAAGVVPLGLKPIQ